MFILKERKRPRRIKKVYRWKISETKELLKMVLDEIKDEPKKYGKPTEYEFYLKISKKSRMLQAIDFFVLKGKMQNMRRSYIEASAWKNKMRAAGKRSCIKSKLKKMCPFWKTLNKIFGKQNIVPNTRQRGSKWNFISTLISIQERRLEFEESLWQEQQEVNAQLLDMEKNKIRLAQEQTFTDVEVKKIELEQTFKLRKLEIEREERLALEKMRLDFASDERSEL